MREQAQAKFATREPTYAILPGLLLSIQWLKISQFSNHPSPPQISTPTLYTTTPALFLYQPPPLCHRNTSTSKNRRQAVRASSHPTGQLGRGAGGRMSTADVEDKINTLSLWGRGCHSLHILLDQPQTVSLAFDLTALFCWSLCCHITTFMRTIGDNNHHTCRVTRAFM